MVIFKWLHGSSWLAQLVCKNVSKYILPWVFSAYWKGGRSGCYKQRHLEVQPSAQATPGKLGLLWSLAALPHPHFKHVCFCQRLTNQPLASISNNLHTSSTYIHSLTHTFWSLFKDFSSLTSSVLSQILSAQLCITAPVGPPASLWNVTKVLRGVCAWRKKLRDS